MISKFLVNIIVLSWLFILSFLSWRNYPIYVDEYASTFLATGICLGCFMNDDVRQIISANPCDSIDISNISANNTWMNTLKCASMDGGNALIYYSFAHAIAKYLGPSIGVFRSLKLFSFGISLLLTFLLTTYIAHLSNNRNALYGGLAFVSIAIPNALFIRTYSMSALLIFTFLVLFKSFIEDRENDDLRMGKYIVYCICALAIPFLHFFNVFYLVLSILWLGTLWYNSKIKLKLALKVLSAPLIGVGLLFIIYFSFNKEGRNYQRQLSSWYLTVSTNPSNSHYKSTVALTPLSNFKVNTRLLGRVLGLKLNQPYYDTKKYNVWQLWAWFFLLLLLIPIILILKTLRFNEIPPDILFWIFLIVGYLFCLNAVAIALHHQISLNEQYVFTVFPFTTLLLSSIFYFLKRNGSGKLIRAAFLIYFIAICSNALIFAIKPPEVSKNAEPAAKQLYLLEKAMSNK